VDNRAIGAVGLKLFAFIYTSRHKYFDETNDKNTHNLKLLPIHFGINGNVILVPFKSKQRVTAKIISNCRHSAHSVIHEIWNHKFYVISDFFSITKDLPIHEQCKGAAVYYKHYKNEHAKTEYGTIQEVWYVSYNSFT